MARVRELLGVLHKYFPQPAEEDRSGSAQGRDRGEATTYYAPDNKGALPGLERVAQILGQLPASELSALSPEERAALEGMKQDVLSTVEAWRNDKTAHLGESGSYDDLLLTRLRRLLAHAANFKTERQRQLLTEAARYRDLLQSVEQDDWRDVRHHAERINGEVTEWLVTEFGEEEADGFSRAVDQPLGMGIGDGVQFLEALAAALHQNPSKYAAPPTTRAAESEVTPPPGPLAASSARPILRDVAMLVLGGLIVAAFAWRTEIAAWIGSLSAYRLAAARISLAVALWLLALVSNAANELVWARVHEKGWRVLLENRRAGALFFALLASSALVVYLTT